MDFSVVLSMTKILQHWVPTTLSIYPYSPTRHFADAKFFLQHSHTSHQTRLMSIMSDLGNKLKPSSIKSSPSRNRNSLAPLRSNPPKIKSSFDSSRKMSSWNLRSSITTTFTYTTKHTLTSRTGNVNYVKPCPSGIGHTVITFRSRITKDWHIGIARSGGALDHQVAVSEEYTIERVNECLHKLHAHYADAICTKLFYPWKKYSCCLWFEVGHDLAAFELQANFSGS